LLPTPPVKKGAFLGLGLWFFLFWKTFFFWFSPSFGLGRVVTNNNKKKGMCFLFFICRWFPFFCVLLAMLVFFLVVFTFQLLCLKGDPLVKPQNGGATGDVATQQPNNPLLDWVQKPKTTTKKRAWGSGQPTPLTPSSYPREPLFLFSKNPMFFWVFGLVLKKEGFFIFSTPRGGGGGLGGWF